MNKFQIIVPTQNSYKVIGKLIKSIKDQTYKHWSVIFIDGKSNKTHINYLKEVCAKDKRFSYLKQNKKHKGIFGAMNQGLEDLEKNSWVLFWGSDDWVYGKNTFKKMNIYLNKLSHLNLDLLICKGKYFKMNGTFYKDTFFSNNLKNKKITLAEYKKLLFLGLTPPHQSTLMHLSLFSSAFKYNDDYFLTGDLDFFCRLSNKINLSAFILDLFLVSMSCGGVSSRNHLKRFSEVKKSYTNLSKNLYMIPFFLRYLLKILKLS